MRARLIAGVSLCSVLVAYGTASADGLVILGIGPSDVVQRPSYSQTPFPGEQHGLFGQPMPPASPYARPTYRETYNAFPTSRLGGGLLEAMVSELPSATAPSASALQAYAPQTQYAPSSAAPMVYNEAATSLPRSGLPDYQPQPPAYYGAPSAAGQQAYNTPVATFSSGASYDPVAADPGIASRPIDPMFDRQEVAYSGHERAGTIIIDTPQKFLFLVEPGGRALRYGIGVGRPGFAWAGIKTISRKAEWPDWTPPREMLQRRPDLPRHMEGGIANPLGARALYLGSSLYRIHGTNEPYTIGTNVSSGCIRMMNQDVEDLYGRVGVGTRVVVM